METETLSSRVDSPPASSLWLAMLILKPTARAADAVSALRSAARTANNVRTGADSAPSRILGAYRQWSSRESILVGQHLNEGELSRVVTSTRYWSLINIQHNEFLSATIRDYVDLELQERIESLNREADALEAEVIRWRLLAGARPYTQAALILDTNVMLTHHHELDTKNWHADLQLPSAEPIGLAIPLQVIRELDRQKMSSNNAVTPGSKNDLRHHARQALKILERKIVDPSEVVQLRAQTSDRDGLVPEINLLLIADAFPGVPLSDPDAEIVDRGQSLLAFASAVYLASYDNAIVFRARQAGIQARKLTYPSG